MRGSTLASFKGIPYRDFPVFQLAWLSPTFPAPPGIDSSRRHPPWYPGSRRLLRNWKFRDAPCPGCAAGGVVGVLEGAIAQMRALPPPQTAGLIVGRGLPEEAQQLAPRARAGVPTAHLEARRPCRPARPRWVGASLLSLRHFADAPRRWAWAPPPSVPGPNSSRWWVSAGHRPVDPGHLRARVVAAPAPAAWRIPRWAPLPPLLSLPPAGQRAGAGAHPHA